MGTTMKKMPKNVNPTASTKLKQGNAPLGGNTPNGMPPVKTTAKAMKKVPQAIKVPKIKGQK